MSALIAGSALRSCFGDGPTTFAALVAGRCGAAPLCHPDPGRLNVSTGYHVPDVDRRWLAGALLARCVTEAVAQAGSRVTGRVVALVGTGLRELSAVEDFALSGTAFPARRLHFGDVVRALLPQVAEVVTLSNACSAGGYALALAQDLVECGEADAVVVAAADGMTGSMLAMIGRTVPVAARRVRPFDRDRSGVLLGDGAAAFVVVPDRAGTPALGRVVSTGLSCDAQHPTAPDVAGIVRAMRDAFARADRSPSTVDIVVAHGTGTALNDPAECTALREVVLGAGGSPLVTAVKGAVGHTSGSAALFNVDVALRCLAGGPVPPVVGLRTALEEGDGIRFVRSAPVRTSARLVQVDAFGFGGVNAVTLLEGVR